MMHMIIFWLSCLISSQLLRTVANQKLNGTSVNTDRGEESKNRCELKSLRIGMSYTSNSI